MNHYFGNIEQDTLTNANFRKVLYTGAHAQLVVMSLKPGEEIGAEVHPSVDQFFRVEQGTAQFLIDGQTINCGEDQAVIVPAGANHNVINTGQQDLKLYTIYSPPNHPPGTIHPTKLEADAAEAEEHGQH
jgi:mannose-6-phosphate isomerase-like protein (cupin superfamily)